MKKALPLTLCAALCATLCACGGGSDAPTVDNTPAPPAAAPSAQTQPEASTPAGTEATKGEAPTVQAGSKYVFSYQGCQLPMNADFGPFLEYLGEPESYFEAASCAFEGLDKTYDYPGFELITYPVGERDFISDVYFLDNTVSTAEGITVGSTLEEVLAAYGENGGDGDLYRYTDGDTELSFLISEGKVTAVEYLALNDQLG